MGCCFCLIRQGLGGALPVYSHDIIAGPTLVDKIRLVIKLFSSATCHTANHPADSQANRILGHSHTVSVLKLIPGFSVQLGSVKVTVGSPF